MSKQCPNCKQILSDEASFCNACGNRFTNGQQQGGGYAGGVYQQNAQYQQNGQYQQNNYSTANDGGVERSMLVDPREKVIDVLTSSPLVNLLTSDGLAKNEMFFSEKRFYTRRKEVSLARGINTQEDIVELKDITGTKLSQTQPIIYFVLAAIELLYSLILAVVSKSGAAFVIGLFTAALLVLSFFLMKGVRIQVFYSGGNSALLFRHCNYKQAAIFHKQLRLYVEANAKAR